MSSSSNDFAIELFLGYELDVANSPSKVGDVRRLWSGLALVRSTKLVSDGARVDEGAVMMGSSVESGAFEVSRDPS